MQTSQSFSILIWANKVKTDSNGQVPLYAGVPLIAIKKLKQAHFLRPHHTALY